MRFLEKNEIRPHFSEPTIYSSGIGRNDSPPSQSRLGVRAVRTQRQGQEQGLLLQLDISSA